MLLRSSKAAEAAKNMVLETKANSTFTILLCRLQLGHVCNSSGGGVLLIVTAGQEAAILTHALVSLRMPILGADLLGVGVPCSKF